MGFKQAQNLGTHEEEKKQIGQNKYFLRGLQQFFWLVVLPILYQNMISWQKKKEKKP